MEGQATEVFSGLLSGGTRTARGNSWDPGSWGTLVSGELKWAFSCGLLISGDSLELLHPRRWGMTMLSQTSPRTESLK